MFFLRYFGLMSTFLTVFTKVNRTNIFHRKVGISLIDVTGNNIFNSYLYSGRASQSYSLFKYLIVCNKFPLKM
jgi:hypothetical protein